MQTLPKQVVMLQNRVRDQDIFLFVFRDSSKFKGIAHYYLP